MAEVFVERAISLREGLPDGSSQRLASELVFPQRLGGVRRSSLAGKAIVAHCPHGFEEALPEGDLDASHFRAVHHHLFQDLYQWAGEPRTIRIAKQDSHFCYPEYIDNELGKLFAKLAADNHLCDLSPLDFAGKAATFLATLNVIHAFREGNGRAQLSFLVLLADNAGHAMNLAALDPDAMLQAMIQSFFGNEAPLAGILASIIDG